MIIRRETQADCRRVEEIIRKAFYNLYQPGCAEHYLAHIMREHPDFIPELSLVAELDGQVVGSILYTKARLVDEAGAEKEILTFGPIAVLPEYQRRGVGKQLMARSFELAAELGYDLVVILGAPANYVGSGFKSCKRYNICGEDGSFPMAMLARELGPQTLDGRRWTYHYSPVLAAIDQEAVERFDQGFAERLEQKYQPSQEAFYIYSHATLQ